MLNTATQGKQRHNLADLSNYQPTYILGPFAKLPLFLGPIAHLPLIFLLCMFAPVFSLPVARLPLFYCKTTPILHVIGAILQ